MIGFIGVGNMGSALLQAVLKFCGESIVFFDKKPLKKNISLKSKLVGSELEVVDKADKIFICVKSKDFEPLASLIKNKITSKHILISVIAGLSLDKIYHMFSGKTELLIRIMPNTPSLVAQGAGGIAFYSGFNLENKNWILNLLNKIGYYFETSENLMHIITAISGCGPAYMFMIIEAFADAGVKYGLGREESIKLASQTMKGSAELILQSNKHPMELKDQVTSPGGITIDALSTLEENRLPFAIMEGVKAAYCKSIKISNKNK